MMSRTNLLPWRQRRRERQRRLFVAELCAVFAAAVCLVCLAALGLDGRIDNQNERNRFLATRIDELDSVGDEIEVIRRRTDATLGHLRTVSGLQGDRAGTVRILEELARTIVPGIHYTSLVRRGTRITAQGVARSNNDVSALMRGIEESARFDTPRLKGIEEARDGDAAKPSAVFELAFATSAASAAATSAPAGGGDR